MNDLVGAAIESVHYTYRVLYSDLVARMSSEETKEFDSVYLKTLF
jgi:hypothetical protein